MNSSNNNNNNTFNTAFWMKACWYAWTITALSVFWSFVVGNSMLFGVCLVASFGLAMEVDCESSLRLQGRFSVSHKLCVTGLFVSVVTGCHPHPVYGGLSGVCLPILIGTGMVAFSIASVKNIYQVYKFYSSKEVVTQPVKVVVGFTLAVFAIKVALTAPSPWVLAKLLDRLIASLLWNLALLLWSLFVGLTWLIWNIVVSLTLFLWNLVQFLTSFAVAVVWMNLQIYRELIKQAPIRTTLLIIMPIVIELQKKLANALTADTTPAPTADTAPAPTADTTPAPTADTTPAPTAETKYTSEPQKPASAPPTAAAAAAAAAPTMVTPGKYTSKPQTTSCRYCLYDDDDEDVLIKNKLSTMSTKELLLCGKFAGLDLYHPPGKAVLIRKLAHNDRIEFILECLEFGLI